MSIFKISFAYSLAAPSLPQKDFASKVNISLRTLQTYEQGKVEAVPFPALKDIAENFHINLDWMFFGDGFDV